MSLPVVFFRFSRNRASNAFFTFLILAGRNECFCNVPLPTVELDFAMSNLPDTPSDEAAVVSPLIVLSVFIFTATDFSRLKRLMSELASSKSPGCISPNRTEALAPEHMPSPS